MVHKSGEYLGNKSEDAVLSKTLPTQTKSKLFRNKKKDSIQKQDNFNDGYILVRGDITVIAACATQVASKNYAPFTKCNTKIDETTIDDAADNVDLVMSMYNLIEYSSNYFETMGSLWFYSKDETTNFNSNIANTNDFKSLKCKAKLLASTVAQPAVNATNGILKNATVVVLLKYLSNF